MPEWVKLVMRLAFVLLGLGLAITIAGGIVVGLLRRRGEAGDTSREKKALQAADILWVCVFNPISAGLACAGFALLVVGIPGGLILDSLGLVEGWL